MLFQIKSDQNEQILRVILVQKVPVFELEATAPKLNPKLADTEGDSCPRHAGFPVWVCHTKIEPEMTDTDGDLWQKVAVFKLGQINAFL